MTKFLFVIALAVSSMLPLWALSLGDNLDRLKDQPLNAEQRACLKQADAILAQPIIRRAATIEEFAKLDGKWGREMQPHAREKMMTNRENARLFVCASADVSASRWLLNELPLLAAAYRLTGDRRYLDYLDKQLAEVTTWDPLQRPGWTLRPDSVEPLKAGGDGVWLATGNTITALVLMLDILPPASLKPELKAKLDAQLKREMERTLKDWQDQRPWYVKQEKVESNQWVVPASGMLLAALTLDKNQYPEAYALAKQSLKRTLDNLGDEGASSEGIGYAIEWTIPALQLSAYFMDKYGDRDFSGHPFLTNFPTWLATGYQPGGNVINCFDWWGGNRGSYRLFANKAAMLAVLSSHPELQWTLFHQHKQVPRDVFGLLALGMPAEKMKTPPLYAVYQRGARASWRSGWEDNADGVWVRGFHELDFHAHDDAGHVNYIKNGKIVLLEAGTGGYSDPRNPKEYQSRYGHNVLEVDNDNTKEQKISIPIEVKQLDASGGELLLKAGSANSGTEKWDRLVEWDLKQMTVSDQIKTKDAKPRNLRLRWHLGTEAAAKLTPSADKREWQISIPAGSVIFPAWYGDWFVDGFPKPEGNEVLPTPAMEIMVKSDIPVTVEAAKQIDHTFKFRARYHEHTTLLVKPSAPAAVWSVTTQIKAE